MAEMVCYALPAPPSVNSLFVEVKDWETGRRKRIKTKVYADWRKAAGWQINVQGRRFMRGPVMVEIAAVRTNGRADIDNLIKAILDVLVEMRVIEDDNMVEEVRARWIIQGTGCLVTVTPCGACEAEPLSSHTDGSTVDHPSAGPDAS